MKKGVLGALCVSLLLLSGCGQDEPTYRVDLSKTKSVSLTQEVNVVTYAFLPQYSHTVSHKRHRLLVDYVRRETGLNVKQIFPNTFDDHMCLVDQGKIDISYSNPFIYVKIAQQFGAWAFARAVEVYGKKDFRGQIICRADNQALQSIDDCRGKRWIAVDPGSAGGYLYPLGYFMENGLKKQDFAEIAFAPGPGGKQENVVLAVYAGRYDIGSIREGTLDVAANKIDVSQIRVLGHTRWYPGWVPPPGKVWMSKPCQPSREPSAGLTIVTSSTQRFLKRRISLGSSPQQTTTLIVCATLLDMLNMTS